MNGEIWQQGFTDHRIRDSDDWQRHLNYIRQNPVEARLAEDAVLYPYIGFPSIAFPQGLKPPGAEAANVRAEARTLRPDQHLPVDSCMAEAVPFQSKSNFAGSSADLRDKRSG